ncbi:MAG: hypothetical protein RL701_425 [Pseudomonadota bacterium]
MKIKSLGLLGVVLAAACGEGRDADESEGHGSLTMALTGVSPTGDTFHLRDATFDISGCAEDPNGGGYYPPGYPYPGPYPYPYAGSGSAGTPANCLQTSLSSEDDLDAPYITKRVLPGYYTVTLQPGWHLEELQSGGTWTPIENALLLSAASQSLYVWDQGAAYANYAFGVDGTLIDFRHGDINISISVTRPDEVPQYPYPPYGGRGPVGGSPVPAGAGGAFPVPAGSGGSGSEQAGAGGAPADADAGTAGN